jgi:hypothetical protein
MKFSDVWARAEGRVLMDFRTRHFGEKPFQELNAIGNEEIVPRKEEAERITLP